MSEEKAKKKEKVNKNIASKVVSDLSAPSTCSVTSLFFFSNKVTSTSLTIEENETGPQSRKQLERRIGMVILFTMSKIRRFILFGDIRLLETKIYIRAVEFVSDELVLFLKRCQRRRFACLSTPGL